MYAYLFILLLIVAPFLVPDWRTPLGWGLAVVAALGLAGLIYGRWLRIRSQQAMIDHEPRTRGG